MEKSNGRSVRDLLQCIAKNLDGLDPKDPRFAEKMERAARCFNDLWLLLGYEKSIRPCLGGNLIIKGK